MAYCIFKKSLRILEECRKNPCVKIPPKSPCTNFQSLGEFKNLVFISKRFPLQIFAQSAQQPRRPVWPFSPVGLTGPTRPSHPIGMFSLLAHSTHPAACLELLPSVAPSLHTMEPLLRALHRMRRLFPPPPLIISWIKHPLIRAISSPIYHWPFLRLNHRPPPPSRSLYKGRAPPSSIAPLLTPLLSAPKRRPH
jgi:hypothetical protein